MLNKERNFQSRLAFVRFWANYVRNKPNKIWSREQSELINSLLKTANQDAELYNRVKKIVSGA